MFERARKRDENYCELRETYFLKVLPGDVLASSVAPNLETLYPDLQTRRPTRMRTPDGVRRYRRSRLQPQSSDRTILVSSKLWERELCRSDHSGVASCKACCEDRYGSPSVPPFQVSPISGKYLDCHSLKGAWFTTSDFARLYCTYQR